MSREASGLRLSADSPAGYQAPTNGMRLEQCWLRYSLLLLVVMAGICSATAMRMVPAHRASSLAAKPADIRSGTGVLPVCAIALLFLGSLRLLLAGVSRERQVETKRQVWSLARESSPRF